MASSGLLILFIPVGAYEHVVRGNFCGLRVELPCGVGIVDEHAEGSISEGQMAAGRMAAIEEE
ncbi:hypothetical protein Dimus_030239, partial [Dionaea muscipula]